MGWSAADIPSQEGRVVVVTGANSGIGLQAAKVLSRKGAHVVMACRNLDKAERARVEVGGSAEVRPLDTASLESVRAFADGLEGRVDVLVNNAGIMAVPQARSVDGFELQLATNFLGHFALTGLLLPRITDRVVTLSSMMHRFGHVDLRDPGFDRRRYRPWAAYGQSKLADLMFAYELQRRLLLTGSPVRSVAAHPGYASTNLQAHLGGPSGSWAKRAQEAMASRRIFVQTAADGALPTLYAATAPDLPGGAYVGPGGPFESTGLPTIVGSSRASRDLDVQRGLWDLGVRLTGVDPALPDHATAA